MRRDEATASRNLADHPAAARAANRSNAPAGGAMTRRDRRGGRSVAQPVASTRRIARTLRAAPGKERRAGRRQRGGRGHRAESHECSVAGDPVKSWTSTARPAPRSCPPVLLGDQDPAGPAAPRCGDRSRRSRRKGGSGDGGRWYPRVGSCLESRLKLIRQAALSGPAGGFGPRLVRNLTLQARLCLPSRICIR